MIEDFNISFCDVCWALSVETYYWLASLSGCDWGLIELDLVVFYNSGRRFTGPRPDGFGDKKEGATASASNDDDDFWGYAEEGSDVTV
jgi:hypothetical protein